MYVMPPSVNQKLVTYLTLAQTDRLECDLRHEDQDLIPS